jgi:hypothetical protein
LNKGAIVLSFILGAAAGVAASWFVIKKQQEEKYQAALEVMEEVYSRRAERDIPEEVSEGEPEPNIPEEENREMSVREYAEKLAETGYTDYADLSKVEESKTEEKKEEVTNVKKPYVISPYDYGEADDYETESLIYYADGVLTDDNNVPIEDVEGTVGKDALNHFGEYEDDSVFVRNERLKIDYEILLDSSKFSDLKRR